MVIKAAKHTCNDGNGPVFGRKTVGCPRCDELLAGKPAVKSWGASKARFEAASRAAIMAHDCKRSNCNPICCTFGDW